MHSSKIISLRSCLIFLCGFIGLGSPAQADTVLLANGDRITGSIIELNATAIKIKTTYAGTLSLDTQALRSFATDSAQHWELNLKPRQILIHSSDKKGHVEIDGRTYAIDELSLSPSKPRWKTSGLLEASLDIDNDKDRKAKSHVNGELNVESKHWRHEIKAEVNRDKEQDRVTEDTTELNYKLDYLFNTHWLARVDSSWREEGTTTTSKYWYLGLGPGYRLWGEAENKLDVIFAYNRFWISSGPVDWELNAWALTLDYKQLWLNNNLETFADWRIAYPEVNTVDYISNTSSGLRYYLTHHLHLSLKYDYNETRYPFGTVRDSSYVLGAGVTF